MRTLLAWSAFALFLTAFPLTTNAQESPVDREVITVALNDHLGRAIPSVSNWVLDDHTQALPLSDLPAEPSELTGGTALVQRVITSSRSDYERRNALRSAAPPAGSVRNASVARLERYSSPAGFDWPALRRDFGPEPWTVRYSRPAFTADGQALLRVDVASEEGGPVSSAILLERTKAGTWRVVTSLVY
jgi:hypothetical protein